LQLVLVSWLQLGRRWILGILSLARDKETWPVGSGIAPEIWISVEIEMFLHGTGILLVD
jgi:hypothetical protein